MEALFKDHLRDKKLLDSGKSYLLALSGGMDSVCLGQLLKRCGIKFSVAHVNFGLRGEESQGDEGFVRALAESWQVPLFVNHTSKEALEATGLSTQMAAREFRYAWFESLLERHGLEAVLVAHHADDQLETIFLNLLRGTGIEGVYGMADIRGRIIRPLLPFSKAQIHAYLTVNGFVWREDHSNEGNDYKRNVLRNVVLQAFEKEMPGSLQQMAGSFQRLKDTGRAFFSLYEDWKKYHVKTEDGFQYLAIQDIAHQAGRVSILYYWIRDFGFSMHDADQIIAAVDRAEAGKSFYAGAFMLNIDRDFLILGQSNFDWPEREVFVHDISCRIWDFEYDLLKLLAPVEIDTRPDNAMFDLGKLVFPVRIRKWEAGDRIMPLGMDRDKKVSDLLIDLKVPLIKKKQVLVLISGDEIAWVIGYRISDRFKIDNRTKEVLYFKKTQK